MGRVFQVLRMVFILYLIFYHPKFQFSISFFILLRHDRTMYDTDANALNVFTEMVRVTHNVFSAFNALFSLLGETAKLYIAISSSTNTPINAKISTPLHFSPRFCPFKPFHKTTPCSFVSSSKRIDRGKK